MPRARGPDHPAGIRHLSVRRRDGPGVVLDTTRFNRILEFDPERRFVRVEPGILLAELNAYLAERGMRFAPDPGSQDLCRIGGMVGHNASGYRSVKYGQTRITSWA